MTSLIINLGALWFGENVIILLELYISLEEREEN